MLWKDHNTVTMLSTIHVTAMGGDKPLVVKDYNLSMKGVDAGDQMVSYYLKDRQPKVWYRKVFFLFHMAREKS